MQELGEGNNSMHELEASIRELLELSDTALQESRLL
jgi:hypothetical protein